MEAYSPSRKLCHCLSKHSKTTLELSRLKLQSFMWTSISSWKVWNTFKILWYLYIPKSRCYPILVGSSLQRRQVVVPFRINDKPQGVSWGGSRGVDICGGIPPQIDIGRNSSTDRYVEEFPCLPLHDTPWGLSLRRKGTTTCLRWSDEPTKMG